MKILWIFGVCTIFSSASATELQTYNAKRKWYNIVIEQKYVEGMLKAIELAQKIDNKLDKFDIKIKESGDDYIFVVADPLRVVGQKGGSPRYRDFQIKYNKKTHRLDWSYSM